MSSDYYKQMAIYHLFVRYALCTIHLFLFPYQILFLLLSTPSIIVFTMNLRNLFKRKKIYHALHDEAVVDISTILLNAIVLRAKNIGGKLNLQTTDLLLKQGFT